MTRVYLFILLCSVSFLSFASESAGAAIFDPTDISNLKLWLDAADSATIDDTTNSGYVEQWSDKSGLDNHSTQTTLSTQPTTGSNTINGLNTLTFSGSQQLQNTVDSIVSGDSDRTVIFLSTSFLTHHADIAFGLGSTHLSRNGAWGIIDTGVYGLGQGNDVVDLSSFGNRGSSTPQIMVVSYDNDSSGDITRLTNGTVVSSGTSRPNAGYNTGDGYVVGNWSNNDRAFTGNIAEIIVYDKLLTDNELNDVQYYLQEKWDIDAGLSPTVPEPGTSMMLLIGLACLAAAKLRRRNR